jgi:hypothetical protein
VPRVVGWRVLRYSPGHVWFVFSPPLRLVPRVIVCTLSGGGLRPDLPGRLATAVHPVDGQRSLLRRSQSINALRQGFRLWAEAKASCWARNNSPAPPHSGGVITVLHIVPSEKLER